MFGPTIDCDISDHPRESFRHIRFANVDWRGSGPQGQPQVRPPRSGQRSESTAFDNQDGRTGVKRGTEVPNLAGLTLERKTEWCGSFDMVVTVDDLRASAPNSLVAKSWKPVLMA